MQSSSIDIQIGMNLKLLYLILQFYSINGNDFIHLIKDFVVSQKTPTRINAYLCWDKKDLFVFQKLLISSNIITTVTRNILFTYNQPEEHQLLVLDMSCNKTNEFLIEAASKQFFNYHFRWLFFNLTSIHDFKDIYLGVGCKLYIVENDFQINTIYKYNEKNNGLIVHKIGHWSREMGLILENEYSILRNRSNLMGLKLNVSYVVTIPDTMYHLEDYRFPHLDSITKNNYIIIKHVVDMMNVTIVPIWRKSWGYKNKTTGLFDGLIGDLQNGTSELGGTSSFITLDRLETVEFTAYTADTLIEFIFRKPPLTYVTNVFTLPFDSHVWIACVTLICLGMVIIYIIVLWEWKDPIFKTSLTHMDYISPLLPDVSDICITQVGLITQQGSESEPKSSSGRIATIFLMISLMFLYCAYSANIVALLQSRTDSIRTVRDLLDSRIKLGVEDIIYNYHFIKALTEPLKKALYDQKIAPNGIKTNFMSIEEGIARVRNEFFAFHVELFRGYKVIADTFHEHEKCSLSTISYINNYNGPYLQLRKNSTYKELVKSSMHRIHESGIQQREFLKIYTKKPICQGQTSSFESVGLIDCYGAFLIIGIGMALSLTLNLLEVLYFRCQLRRKIQRMIQKRKNWSF